MGFLAGQIVTAGQLDRIQPTSYHVAANGTLTMTTTTETDIPGASISLTTKAANATYKAEAVFDAEVLALSTTVLMLGKLQVDGVGETGVAVHAMDTADRDTVAMIWQGTLPAAGGHTFKLRGNLSGALGTGGRFQTGDTKLTVTITEVV